jgi:hypothetical protein
MPTLANIIARVNQLPRADDELEVEWVGPSSPEAIQRVENILGVHIQGGYREFVLAVGGGGLRQFYISPVPRDRPADGACSDTLDYRQRSHRPMPHYLVVIQRDADDNEPLCLDTSRIINGENPVVLYYHQNTGYIESIADSFLEFYLNCLEPYFDEAKV